jgi:hypothetical protein
MDALWLLGGWKVGRFAFLEIKYDEMIPSDQKNSSPRKTDQARPVIMIMYTVV